MKQSTSLSIVVQSTRKKLMLDNLTTKEKVHEMVAIPFLKLQQGRKNLISSLSGLSAEHIYGKCYPVNALFYGQSNGCLVVKLRSFASRKEKFIIISF